MTLKEWINYLMWATLLLFIYILLIQLQTIIDKYNSNNKFTYKDWQVLYELCKKKTWSKTKFILESYWEEETKFKEYILNK